MLPDIMARVTGRVFRGRHAELRNYQRFTVRGETYPGLAPCPGVRVQGILYSGLDAHDMNRLDAFEGNLYERMWLMVHPRRGPAITAFVYVVCPQRRAMLTTEIWDAEAFLRNEARRFEERYEGFARVARKCAGPWIQETSPC
jgi:gamma-glutamylcyclotransferase (GGCT)/AIG2-like uncharacterized protein YtfP